MKSQLFIVFSLFLFVSISSKEIISTSDSGISDGIDIDIDIDNIFDIDKSFTTSATNIGQNAKVSWYIPTINKRIVFNRSPYLKQLKKSFYSWKSYPTR